MQATAPEHRQDAFSFHRDSVLVIDNFWTREERAFLRDGMREARWKALADLPNVRSDFPHSGNWAKAAMEGAQARLFLDRVSLPCIRDYIESFPNIRQRHLSFNYYAYAAGDCLPTHDDTVQGHPMTGARSPLRRLALATYLHDEWHPDWGGELVIYSPKPRSGSGRPELTITHCIAPQPGSLVLFTVPRLHRVCRVDPLAGMSKRLSIAGWFMTEHDP